MNPCQSRRVPWPAETLRRWKDDVGETIAPSSFSHTLGRDCERISLRALSLDVYASQAGRLRALQTGLYGRCVYRCDNDAVDHQMVNLEFESGASGVLVMQGHSHDQARTMRYDGTRATLRGRFSYGNDSAIEVHDHLTGRIERITHHTEGRRGGERDEKMIAAFIRAVRDPSCALTTASESLESHLMAFAAEEARLKGTVVDLSEFRTLAATSVSTISGS